MTVQIHKRQWQNLYLRSFKGAQGKNGKHFNKDDRIK